MAGIDPTARVDQRARIGRDVEIGAYSIVGPDVTLGDGCRIAPHVVIVGRTTIGARTRVGSFSSIGTPPQSVHYKGEDTELLIGADCDIREHVTMNIGTKAGRGKTVIGDHCMLMVGAHVAHDCIVGHHVIFANQAVLGGFVEVGDHVFLGGHCALLQETRVGEHALIGGLTGVTADVLPFMIVDGQTRKLAGLNRIGLRRRGFSEDEIRTIFKGYRSIFFGPDSLDERLERTRVAFADHPHVLRMIEFADQGVKKPLMLPRSRSTSTV